MSGWIAVVAAGFGSYLLRISMVVLLGRRPPSTSFIRITGLVLPAALASLAAAALVGTAGAGAGHATAPVLGAAVTAVVAATTSSSTTALLAGMASAAVAAATVAPL